MTAPLHPTTTRRSRTAAGDAEMEIERDYARLEPEILRTVRGKLAAAGTQIDDGVLDASYNQAWHALYAARSNGQDIENRAGFLVQVTYRRTLDELRATRRDVATDFSVESEAIDQDLEGDLDDQMRLRALMQGLRERLDDRELSAATLCYLQGYTRPEAARALGVRPRRFEKVMDHVSQELSGLVGDLRGGDWCESRRSLISAYALGVLDADGERYRLAAGHLEDCPACRRRVLCMRGLAGVAPPMPLLLAGLPGGASGVGSALAERWTWLSRASGHWTEIGAGGAAVVAATSALVIVGPPGDTGTPRSTPPAAVASVPSPQSAERLRTMAARSLARARARASDGQRAEARRRQAAPPPASPSTPAPAETPPVVAEPPPVAVDQPAPAAPPPSSAAPAGDGWEEFELR